MQGVLKAAGRRLRRTVKCITSLSGSRRRVRRVRQPAAVSVVNAGSGAEQFIGQHLQYLLAERPNRELNYWLREGRSNNAEVDYVAEFGGHVVPIEVEAGRAGALKSLHQFVAEKRVGLAVRFDASPPSLQTVDPRVRRGGGSERVRYPLLSLPLYLVERLPRILDGLEAVS